MGHEGRQVGTGELDQRKEPVLGEGAAWGRTQLEPCTTDIHRGQVQGGTGATCMGLGLLTCEVGIVIASASAGWESR